MLCFLYELVSNFLTISLISFGLYSLYERYKGKELVKDVDKKCIFVTGCDSGFGKAIAQSLDKKGCHVIAGCYSSNGAEELQRISSQKLSTVILDISSTKSIKEAHEKVKEIMPPSGLWGIVNNAGVGSDTGPIEFFTRDDYSKLYEVNVFGTCEVTRIFLPLLKTSCGRVVNMSSVSGLVAFTNGAPYSSSKFALECLSDCLRREMVQWNVSVSIVEPGLYKTNLMTTEHQAKKARAKWATLPQSSQEDYGPEYLEESIEQFVAFNEKFSSSDLTPVTDAVNHALFSVLPRRRYILSFRSYIYKILQVVPSAFVDHLMIKMIKAPKPKVLRRNDNNLHKQ